MQIYFSGYRVLPNFPVSARVIDSIQESIEGREISTRRRYRASHGNTDRRTS